LHELPNMLCHELVLQLEQRGQTPNAEQVFSCARGQRRPTMRWSVPCGRAAWLMERPRRSDCDR
jgi:hypothetical protein